MLSSKSKGKKINSIHVSSEEAHLFHFLIFFMQCVLLIN